MNRRRMRRARRGQDLAETVILVAAVLLATAWAAIAFPRAIQTHYEGNREVLSGPM